MFAFTKRLFGGEAGPELPADIAQRLAQWRKLPQTNRDGAHFYTRYVAVDVATAGLDATKDAILGIAGVGIIHGGVMVPDDAFAADLGSSGDPSDHLQPLAAFLDYTGKCPLVTYQAPFVEGFLSKAMVSQLGVHFQPEWIDLAWLLPDLFSEIIVDQVPMDAWLEAFAIEIPGRRDALSDALAMARLLQVALPRAVARGADSPGKLADIAKARRHLRQ